jgi:hypothetical protein
MRGNMAAGGRSSKPKVAAVGVQASAVPAEQAVAFAGGIMLENPKNDSEVVQWNFLLDNESVRTSQTPCK